MSKSLTLGKLSEYDDLLTDHLIDKVFFWTKTHKADKHKIHSSRNVKTIEIVDILQKHVIPPTGKISDAVKAFLTLATPEIFYKGLDVSQKKDFQRHLRKYLSIYLPSAGFEICSTDRYPGPKSESCVIANKNFKPGEVLKCLAGTIVAMTEEEEDYYEAEHDFSILHSSRLDSMCLFLGPARFVNHDCKPNGAFVTQGGAIAITAVKPVKIGDEITVFYSPDYFGPENADCLCATCEKTGSGGYRTEDERKKARNNQHFDVGSQNGSAHSKSAQKSGKRNHVQTIEVEAHRSSRTLNSKSSVGAITPPASDLSLDDAARTMTVDVSSADEHYHSMDDMTDTSGEEAHTYVKKEASDDDCTEKVLNLNHVTIDHIDTTILAAHSLDPGLKDDLLYRKGLRPRKATFDYNLKRQSLLSLVPHGDDEEYSFVKNSEAREPGADYCEVCGEKLPYVAIIEEIWSINAAKGYRPIICKRCERHAKLYRDPWPRRTPVIVPPPFRGSTQGRPTSKNIRSASPTSLPGPSPTSRARSDTVSGRPSPIISHASHELPLSDDKTLSTIEFAKARMKQGNMIIPRLAALANATHRPPTLLYPGKAPLRPKNEPPVDMRPETPDAKSSSSIASDKISHRHSPCQECFRQKHQCSRVDTGALHCDRCLEMVKRCLDRSYAEDSSRIILDHAYRLEAKPDPTSGSKTREQSPDSQMAAFQVKSAEKLFKHKVLSPQASHDVYSFAHSNESPRQLLKKSLNMKSQDQINPRRLFQIAPRNEVDFTDSSLLSRASSDADIAFSNATQSSMTPITRPQTSNCDFGNGMGILQELSQAHPLQPLELRANPDRIKEESTQVSKGRPVTPSHKLNEEAAVARSQPEVSNTSKLKRKASSSMNKRSEDPVGQAEASKDVSPLKKRSTAGSWYYVEVESSDSDAPPEILSGRTRGQQKFENSIPNDKVYIDLSSDEEILSAEVVPYTPPLKIKQPRRSRPRRQLWEYISVNSEDEEESKNVIIQEPRSARRKSVASYKE